MKFVNLQLMSAKVCFDLYDCFLTSIHCSNLFKTILRRGPFINFALGFQNLKDGHAGANSRSCSALHFLSNLVIDSVSSHLSLSLIPDIRGGIIPKRE